MSASLALHIEHTVITCIVAECGIAFSVPPSWVAARRNDHRRWYCPNGHVQWYDGPSDAEKLRAEVERLKTIVVQKDERIREERRCVDRVVRSRDAYKGQITKIKNRVSNGVCPCCGRTFQNLGRHMSGQHPEWRAQDIG